MSSTVWAAKSTSGALMSAAIAGSSSRWRRSPRGRSGRSWRSGRGSSRRPPRFWGRPLRPDPRSPVPAAAASDGGAAPSALGARRKSASVSFGAAASKPARVDVRPPEPPERPPRSRWPPRCLPSPASRGAPSRGPRWPPRGMRVSGGRCAGRRARLAAGDAFDAHHCVAATAAKEAALAFVQDDDFDFLAACAESVEGALRASSTVLPLASAWSIGGPQFLSGLGSGGERAGTRGLRG